VLASILHPAQALLPYYGLAYSVTVWSALMQVAATKMSDRFATLCRGHGNEVLAGIKHFTQLVQDTSELVLIVFAAWAALSLKDRLIAWVAARLAADNESGNDFIIALLTPLSSVLGAAIFVAAAATALSAYGINVGPLMASVGGIGLAVGLATQSLAANVVSALALYSGRPFVVGDRIQLLAGGAPVVEGIVEAVDPVRTTIIDDDRNPIYMSNTEVTACVIRNLSQGQARRQAA
jgi:small-conductance mechanosensitive channel